MKTPVTSCSGCINVLLTNPLWVVNSRLKMAGIKNDVQKYKGTLDGLIKITMEVNSEYIISPSLPSMTVSRTVSLRDFSTSSD